MIGVRSGIDEYGQPSEFVVSGYVGEFKYFGFSDVPPHCLACDGSEVSRETYNELFTVFGETFGAGDGVSTFNLPDLRGAFLRCTGGNAAALGVQQGDAIRDIQGWFRNVLYQDEGEDLNVGMYTYGCFEIDLNVRDAMKTASQTEVFRSTGDRVNFGANKVVPTAGENRPINYAVNICVVYE